MERCERLPYNRGHFKSTADYMRQWLVDMGFVGGFGLGLVEGGLGGGKSLFGYTVALWVKHLFGIKVTVDQQPTPKFGEYTYFDIRDDLLKEKELIDRIARRGDRWEGPEVEQLKLYKHFVFFDEFYKVAHKRRSMNILTLELEDIIKQIRHMDTFLLVAMPRKNEVDVGGIETYITVDIRASWAMFKPDTALYTVYNRNLNVESTFSIYGPNYWDYYNSKNPIRTRRAIDPKEFKKWQKKISGGNGEGEEEESKLIKAAR